MLVSRGDLGKMRGASSVIRNQAQRHRRKKTKGKLSGKVRFRALVRKVIANKAWLAETQISKHVDDTIKKNVMMMEVIAREKYNNLTLASKALLRKDAILRTEEDIEHLYRVIGNLKCFRRYPENVRKELVASAYFEYYGPGRVIVKQTHESSFLGFVLRGELEVTVTKEDPVFGKLVTEVTTHLQSGAVFGEVSLLHNIPRTATVTTLTAVELLVLKKDDFDRVLKASMKKQWDEISQALKQFPYFDDWDDVAIRECCMLSDTAQFDPQDLILANGHGKLTSAHFVLNGTCSVIQKLAVHREGTRYKLLPSQTLPGPGVEPLFMQVCLFIKGGCFNIGEPLADRSIVAESDVKLLRIPLYMLRQHNTANIWHRIRQFLESRLTSEEDLFRRFQEARRWNSYKKDLCRKLRNPNTVNHTTIHDAPYYWRVLYEKEPQLQTGGKLSDEPKSPKLSSRKASESPRQTRLSSNTPVSLDKPVDFS